MELRTVRRGLVTLAIAGTLGLAGAGPAAAAERGWFERGLTWLSGLWTVEDAGAKARPDGGVLSMIAAAMSSTEKGMGLDPNGEGVETEPPPGD